jgi:cytochrome c-type biogenesis protein CcmF
VGAPYFNQVAVPLGVAILFLMGIGPALPWGAARLDELQYRLLLPVALGVAAVLLLLAGGIHGIATLITIGLVVFVLVVTLGRVLALVGGGSGGERETGLTQSIRRLASNPRRYGGYLAHIGILLVVAGIAASQSYQVRHTAALRPGESTRVDGYSATYLGWRPIAQSNRMEEQAAIRLSSDGHDLGTLYPSQNFYPGQSAVITAAVREEPLDMVGGLFSGTNPIPDLARLFHGNNPFEDVYVTLQSVPPRAGGLATIEILVNPLVGLIWLGGAIAGLGGLAALAPVRRRRRVTVVAPEGVRLKPEEVSA